MLIIHNFQILSWGLFGILLRIRDIYQYAIHWNIYLLFSIAIFRAKSIDKSEIFTCGGIIPPDVSYRSTLLDISISDYLGKNYV